MQNQPNPVSADVCTVFPAAKPQRVPRAKRLQGLRTELLQKAENLGLVPPGESLLPAAPKFTQHENKDGFEYRRVMSGDGAGSEIRLQNAYQPAYFERPGRWYGHETRVDTLGRKWSRALDHEYVIDNFGDLVPVPA